MSDVIDLAAERVRRTELQPDPQHVHVDADGVTWHEFTCTYADGDDEFVFPMWALDFADAERRLKLVSSGRVDGQVFSAGYAPL